MIVIIYITANKVPDIITDKLEVQLIYYWILILICNFFNFGISLIDIYRIDNIINMHGIAGKTFKNKDPIFKQLNDKDAITPDVKNFTLWWKFGLHDSYVYSL